MLRYDFVLNLPAEIVLCIKGVYVALNGKTISELPYGIAQCYLPPDTGKRAPH